MDDENIIEIERLQSAVLLARGSFHQFGNLLTLIGGYASLVRASLAPGSEDEEHMGRIEQAVKQASSLLDDTHRFVRGRAVEPGTFDAGRVAGEAAQLLEATFPRLDVRTDPGEARVHGSQRRLFDAIMHLCLNALEAMGHEGVIHIEVTHEEGAGGPLVCLAVTDEGTGMGGDLIEEAIETGFTSWPNEGIFRTGLGLPAVRAIVESMHGSMEIGSGDGGGTRVKMRFPSVKP